MRVKNKVLKIVYFMQIIILILFTIYGWKTAVFNVENWPGDECPAQATSNCSTERADAFKNKMNDFGHTSGCRYTNNDVQAADFHEDRDFSGHDNWCADGYRNGDEVGALWYSGHGGLKKYNYIHPEFIAALSHKNGSNYWCAINGEYIDDNECLNCDSTGHSTSKGCWIHSECMRLGENPGNYYANPYNGYSNYAFFDTCCSATLNYIDYLWDQTGQGVHIIGGFNNIKSDPIYWWWFSWHCNSDAADWVENFVEDVHSGSSITESFLINLKWETKACPVIIAFDTSSNSCYNRLDNENWENSNWYTNDPVNGGSVYCYQYFENCPGNGTCGL